MTVKKKAAPKKAVAKRKKPKPVPGFHGAPDIASPDQMGRALDEIIIAGDVSSLTVPQRAEFLGKLALSMGLNPLSQPFELITLNGKLTIYAKKGAADQLREKHKIKCEVTRQGYLDEAKTAYYVEVKVQTPDSEGNYDAPGCRSEMELGCSGVDGLTSEALGNSHMRAYTKAKRRATLAFCGFGGLDEMEIDSIQQAASVPGGVGSPRRLTPRITPAPVPAGQAAAKPIVIPATEIPNDPTKKGKPVDAIATKTTGKPIVLPGSTEILPPVKPPITAGK